MLVLLDPQMNTDGHSDYLKALVDPDARHENKKKCAFICGLNGKIRRLSTKFATHTTMTRLRPFYA
jgi:hypothetical protein